VSIGIDFSDDRLSFLRSSKSNTAVSPQPDQHPKATPQRSSVSILRSPN